MFPFCPHHALPGDDVFSRQRAADVLSGSFFTDRCRNPRPTYAEPECQVQTDRHRARAVAVTVIRNRFGCVVALLVAACGGGHGANFRRFARDTALNVLRRQRTWASVCDVGRGRDRRGAERGPGKQLPTSAKLPATSAASSVTANLNMGISSRDPRKGATAWRCAVLEGFRGGLRTATARFPAGAKLPYFSAVAGGGEPLIPLAGNGKSRAYPFSGRAALDSGRRKRTTVMGAGSGQAPEASGCLGKLG